VDALQQEADRLARQAPIELPYVVTEFYPERSDPVKTMVPPLSMSWRALDPD
jgi:hypothetical protein